MNLIGNCWAVRVINYAYTCCLRWIIRLSLEFKKTNLLEKESFKSFCSTPNRIVEQTFPINLLDLDNILNTINTDFHFKLFRVNKDISLIIKCLFEDREELFIKSIDYLVISKLSMEILIFKDSKNYNGAMIINIMSYKNNVFKFHIFLVSVLILISFCCLV